MDATCISNSNGKQPFDLPATQLGILPSGLPLSLPAKPGRQCPGLQCLSHLLCLANSGHHPSVQDPSFSKLPYTLPHLCFPLLHSSSFAKS